MYKYLTVSPVLRLPTKNNPLSNYKFNPVVLDGQLRSLEGLDKYPIIYKCLPHVVIELIQMSAQYIESLN